MAMQLKFIWLLNLRGPGDGSTLLQKSHHNSLVLNLCDIVIILNVTKVVLIGSWGVFSFRRALTL